MGEDVLVEPKIADAVTFIRRLDQIGESPNFVAWFYSDVYERWRLMISSAAVDELLGKDHILAYRHVLDVLRPLDIPSFSSSDLQIVESTSKLVSILRSHFDTGPTGIARFSYFDITFSGEFVRGIVVLRSNRQWKPSPVTNQKGQPATVCFFDQSVAPGFHSVERRNADRDIKPRALLRAFVEAKAKNRRHDRGNRRRRFDPHRDVSGLFA